MSLPTPPRYVVLPHEVIEQAYAGEKPKRALLASFTRIISLAWEAKYQHTPALNETELIAFLKLSRRQYFEQRAEMEAMGWLRSSHPRPGFVQFDFSRSISEKVISAENRTGSAENRTDIERIEEEELIKLINSESESSSSISEEGVRKIALEEAEVQKTAQPTKADRQLVTRMISSLYLVFDPMQYGLLDLRAEFLKLAPGDVLGWIAKAYQDRKRLTDPISLIVAKLGKCEKPHPYAVEHAQEILPEAYMEKIGLLQLRCGNCDAVFTERAAFDSHMRDSHPAPEPEEETEFDDGVRVVVADGSVREPINGGLSAEMGWQSVLGQLQMEMPRASYDTWVRDTHTVRYDGNSGTLSVGVRNAYARDWLESRITSTAQRLLVGILDRDVRVEFVVA